MIVFGNILRFSNPGDGFDLSVSNLNNDITYLHFRPWDGLAAFASAVVDYSWSCGLTEVSNDDLKMMEKSFQKALTKVKEELEYQNGKR